MTTDRIEGYWRVSKDEVSPLPWPEPDQNWEGRERFLSRLAQLEASGVGMDYMGYSQCRLCGRNNGTSEFIVDGWTWPDGLRHYIAEHGVRPSPQFEAFVLGGPF